MNDSYKGYSYDYMFAVAQHDNHMDDTVISDAILKDYVSVPSAFRDAHYKYTYNSLPFDDMDDY